MLLTWSMLAGFIFLLAPQNWTNKFQFAFARIFYWPLSMCRSISLHAHMQPILTDVVPRREYNKLQNHLTNIIAQRDQARREVETLSGLRNRFGLDSAALVLADVYTVSINGSQSEFIINRGKNDGLLKDQFVLGDNSIIGTISDVDSRTARVKLITDSTSNIAVKIAGVDRVMQGTGNNSAKIPMLSIKKHKVKVGDIVHVRKKPGFLDVPMVAGKVTQCKRDDENPRLWDIIVKPVCDIETLNDVAVIVMNPQQ